MKYFLASCSDRGGPGTAITSLYLRQNKRQFIANFKQLLDEVFVIFRIIKVQVGVITWSWRLRLTILTKTLIRISSVCSFTDGKEHKEHERHMITLRNHALWSYMTWLPVILGVLDMIIISSAARRHYRLWFRKFTVRFWANQKRDAHFDV